MSLTDLAEFSILGGLFVLVILMAFSLLALRPGTLKGMPWNERLRRLGRLTLVRLPVAAGAALAILVLGAAALTLNSHRPPADTNPVVRVPPGTKSASVTLDLRNCGESMKASVKLNGPKGLAIGPVRIYSDDGGWRRLALKADGNQSRTRFSETDPTEKRSLLSCYLQLPVVEGAGRGYEVKLRLPDSLEVDRDSSVPAPGAYSNGLWVWTCREGRECPAFAAINYSIEEGTKQVIVLVLASVFGALIALLVGEVLIEWARRRPKKPDPEP